MKSHQIAAGVIGLCVWSLAICLQAKLIIEDTFTNYPDNALITVNPAGAGIGLTGNWSLASNNDDFYVNRTQADLTAGTGKAVYDRDDGFNGTRQAIRSTSDAHELYQNDGDLFYASFLIDPPVAGGHMTFELELTQFDGTGAAGFAFGITGGQYLVGNGDNNIAESGGTVTTGEQLVLVRIEYGDADTGADDNELITLWVDPVDELSTPVLDNVAVDFLNRGGGKVTSISMRGQQMGGAPAFFDDLRVGTTFAAVIPEPSTMTLLALGLVALIPLIRRRR